MTRDERAILMMNQELGMDEQFQRVAALVSQLDDLSTRLTEVADDVAKTLRDFKDSDDRA